MHICMYISIYKYVHIYTYMYTTHDISKNQHVHWKIPVSASFCTFDFYCMNISLWYPRKILMTSITAQDHPPPGTGKAMELSQTQRWEPEIGGGLRGCCEKKALNYEENWDFNHKNIVLKHKDWNLRHQKWVSTQTPRHFPINKVT